ncbi:MAG TPA: hypothetical protein VF075_11065 [Pyrinomonadaceae bacterium]
MSDFLNRLVDRTLQLAPVVQPRLASLFEPQSMAAAPETVAMPETNSISGDSQSSEATPKAVSSTIRLPIQASQPALSETAPVHRKTISEELSSAEQPSNRPLPGNDLKTPNVPAAALHEKPFSAEAVNSLSAIENVRTVKEKEPPLDSPANNQQQVQSKLIRPTSISPKPQSVAYEAQQPSRTSRGDNSQASIPAEQPETVVVTIGRVDVRAVFTQPTATRQPNRESAKPMSLDQYLKQRSEGRR